jgi:subtilisin family serine protease
MKKTLLAIAVLMASTLAPSAPQEIRIPAGAELIPGSYIVLLEDQGSNGGASSGLSMSQIAVDMATRYNGTITYLYDSINGFAINMKEENALQLAGDARVKLVEQDQVMRANVTQTGATWGIDRIDQRNLPRSTTYTYNTTASNVHAYIIDTGIRTAHTQFGGRASADFTAVGGTPQDGNGHGTHVSGTVGGSTWGVAKGVRLHAVRVLDASGSGSNAGVIAGVNFVANNRILPAVANMSLGGGASTALDNAVNAAIGRGVTFAIAAGNSNANACNSSPARVAAAITVGSTTSTDARSSFSNFGTCVDIFAPGSSITSAWNTSNTATNTISGTSMATPHVAGVAALYLATHTGASPATVRNAMVAAATTNHVGNPGAGSPNRLLFSLIPQ